MMNKEMYKDSALLDSFKERMIKYKLFAVAFSYPNETFFEFFPENVTQKEKLISEYDRFSRTGKIWLYGTEHLTSNEFQKVNYLSDIMGFYKAFGVEPNNDRADHISAELEFMHFLIFKTISAAMEEKREICIDAQKQFFNEHLFPGAIKISELIIRENKDNFYGMLAKEMTEFLKIEKDRLK